MSEAGRRNPGPTWGYAFLRRLDRISPRPLTRALLGFGTFFAWAWMGKQRRQSQAFLTDALGREPTWREGWRHFFAFAEFLMERFRVASGRDPTFLQSDESEDRVEALARGEEQALYGTFHFGMSDLMGFWLTRFGVSVRMVRHQVGNSDDLARLEARFGGGVGFIWVNDPSDLLFALKGALEDGYSVAMECDRVQHSSKRERFRFLGRERWFPFTIYHLSALFGLPVVFAFGVPAEEGKIEVHSSRVFRPEGESKAATLAAAKAHFRETLELLESLVERNPYLWFNFEEGLPPA